MSASDKQMGEIQKLNDGSGDIRSNMPPPHPRYLAGTRIESERYYE